MVRLIVFTAFSAVLLYISRASMKNPRAHGFYRFFAWECILALVFLNIDGWFRNPFAAHQLASWLLLTASLLPGLSGIYYLHTRGTPDSTRRRDGSLVGIEKTTVLVTAGAFRYIRHPLYSSLLLLAWGVFLKRPSAEGAVLALGATGFLIATAKVEEAENLGYFGPEYRSYKQKTKMFIPFVF